MSALTAAALAMALAVAAHASSGEKNGALFNSGGGPDGAQTAADGSASGPDSASSELGSRTRPPGKKGLNAAPYIRTEAYESAGASWAHGRAADGSGLRLPEDVEYVPEIDDGQDLDPQFDALARLEPKPRALVAREEPEDMPPAAAPGGKKLEPYLAAALMAKRLESAGLEAGRRWSKLAKFARWLGARGGAPSAKADGLRFLKPFLKTADAGGARPDFVAVRWYGPPKFDRFKRDVQKVCDEAARPVWLTEFAVVDWDALRRGHANIYDNEVGRGLIEDFMRAALPWLEANPCVERYAWFHADPRETPAEDGSPPTSAPLAPSMLWDAGDEPTELGRIYAACALAPGRRPPAICRPQ